MHRHNGLTLPRRFFVRTCARLCCANKAWPLVSDMAESFYLPCQVRASVKVEDKGRPTAPASTEPRASSRGSSQREQGQSHAKCESGFFLPTPLETHLENALGQPGCLQSKGRQSLRWSSCTSSAKRERITKKVRCYQH